jgi:hypothetical protein
MQLNASLALAKDRIYMRKEGAKAPTKPPVHYKGDNAAEDMQFVRIVMPT